MRDIDKGWNDEIREDLGTVDYSGLVVYSRDWTVDTIMSQLRQKNIDLHPKFQRRNAWTDIRRSTLIESLIIGVPVPELVLAEHSDNKREYIILDGKQRLLAIAGFVDPEEFGSWGRPHLQFSRSLEQPNPRHGLAYAELSPDDERNFMNADVRCTVISNYSSTDVLYDIFYRLNTGSVALSTQELRQVLKRGKFADFLVEITNSTHGVQEVLNLSEPDARLRDVEIILRFMAFDLGVKPYDGNLKRFLDDTMGEINNSWTSWRKKVLDSNSRLEKAILLGHKLLGSSGTIGRKYDGNSFLKRFNKAVFEVQCYYFSLLAEEVFNNKTLTPRAITKFQERHMQLWANDTFVRSVEVTTKSVVQYRTRFQSFESAVNDVFGTKFRAAAKLFPES